MDVAVHLGVWGRLANILGTTTTPEGVNFYINDQQRAVNSMRMRRLTACQLARTMSNGPRGVRILKERARSEFSCHISGQTMFYDRAKHL